MKNPRWLSNLLTADPALEDHGARQMVIGVLSIALAVDVFMLAIDVNQGAMIAFGLLLLVALVLAWRGHLKPGRLLVPLAALVMFGYLMFRNFGLRDTAVLGLPMVLLAASLMLGRLGTLIYGGLSLALIAVLGLAESRALVNNPMSVHNTPADYITVSVSIILLTALQWLIIGRLNDNIDSARRSEGAQRQANEALRASEARQRALLSAIPELVFRIRRDGVFLDYHAPDAARLATPPDAFLGQPLQAVMPPQVAEQALHALEQVLTGGQPAQFEYALTVDSEVRYFDARMVSSGPDEVLTTVRDITERKQTEDDLKRYATQTQQRASLLSLLNEVGQAVSTLRDLDGVLAVIYQQARRSLPLDVFMVALYHPETNLIEFPFLYDSGQRWQEPPSPLDATSLMGRVIEQGEPYLLNRTAEEVAAAVGLRPPLGDATRLSASMIFAPLRAAERVIGVISVQSYTLHAYTPTDVTLLVGIAHQAAIAIENARLYSALRDSEALYQSLVEVMPMSVCRKDTAGRFTFVNQRYCHEFQLSPAEILGKTDFDLHPLELAEKYLVDDRAVMDGGRTIEQVEEHEPIGGVRVYVQVFKSPVYNARGEVTGIQVVFWDVSDRKRAEAALQQREAYLRAMLDNFPFWVWLKDTANRFLAVNHPLASAHGYAEVDALVGKTDYDLSPPHLAAKYQADDVSVMAQRAQMFVEEIVTENGVEKWFETFKSPIFDAAGAVLGTTGFARDITDRKRVEAERENLIRELENRNAELERFTYTVSHDLKSPLITIRGFLGFLLKDAQAGNTERLTADIKRIGDAADKMQRLLNELLELSRVGRLMNPPVEVPFEEVVRDALALVHGRLLTRPATVRLVSALPTVYGDRVRLVEVVQNLVDNAVKFARAETELQIEIGVRTDEPGGEPIFCVRDNGIGIEPQYHERVFGLFNKLDAQSEGTGVGLALVKRIVEVHGGRIWVESAGRDGGSTFCFTLASRAAWAGKSDRAA